MIFKNYLTLDQIETLRSSYHEASHALIAVALNLQIAQIEHSEGDTYAARTTARRIFKFDAEDYRCDTILHMAGHEGERIYVAPYINSIDEKTTTDYGLPIKLDEDGYSKLIKEFSQPRPITTLDTSETDDRIISENLDWFCRNGNFAVEYGKSQGVYDRNSLYALLQKETIRMLTLVPAKHAIHDLAKVLFAYARAEREPVDGEIAERIIDNACGCHIKDSKVKKKNIATREKYLKTLLDADYNGLFHKTLISEWHL